MVKYCNFDYNAVYYAVMDGQMWSVQRRKRALKYS